MMCMGLVKVGTLLPSNVLLDLLMKHVTLPQQPGPAHRFEKNGNSGNSHIFGKLITKPFQDYKRAKGNDGVLVSHEKYQYHKDIDAKVFFVAMQ